MSETGDYISREAFLAEKRHLYCENCARRKGMKNGKMKFIYEIGDAPCRACDIGDVLDDVEDFPAADAIEELLQKTQQLPRWIPVAERLPKKTGVYLAWMKWDLTEPEEEPSAYPIEYDAEEEAFGWWKSYYDAETLGWAGEDFIRYEGITHWMPLPQPPKEET